LNILSTQDNTHHKKLTAVFTGSFEWINYIYTLLLWTQNFLKNSDHFENLGICGFFEGKLEGRRCRGRPRVRWINDVEDDLRELGVKPCRTKALQSEKWASIIKEAKAKQKGP
jgi:hypothetical protein